MDKSLLNEYTLLYVFCVGVLCQSLFAVRSFKDITKSILLIVLCLIPAWYIPEPADRRFAVPLIWALFYAVLFSIVFRESLLPKVTALVLFCHTWLLYYVLYLALEHSPVEMPRSMIIAGLTPGVLVALTVFAGLLKYGFFRTCCYVWYLAALCLVIACQWSLENLVSLSAGRSFPLDLFVYVFLGGGVVFLLVSHLIQILMLIPAPSRASHRIILDAIMGPVTYHKEQAAMMAGRFLEQRIRKKEWIVIVVYPVLLIANGAFQMVPHGIVINLSILALFWFVSLPE